MATFPVKGTIDKLYAGVSQQNSIRRSEGQSEELINCRLNLAEDVTSRAGTTHVKTFTLGSTQKPFTKEFEWGLNKDLYQLVISNAGVKVIDSDHAVHDVTSTPIGTYLTAADPRAAFQMHYFNDKLYILNKDKVCAMTSDVIAARTGNLLIYSPQVSYDRTYELFIDDVSKGTYSTPEFATPGTGEIVVSPDLSSTAFLAWLQPLLTTAGISTVLRGTNIIAAALTSKRVVIVTDSARDDVRVFKDDVASVGFLPNAGIDGYRLKYTGRDDETYNDYWLEFVADNSDSGIQPGRWIESMAAGMKYKIDAATMPCVLYLNGSTWTLKQEAWVDKTVGVDEIPLPTFVGNTLNWIGSFQNRLVVLSQGNFVATQTMLAAELPNFFVTTLKQALPTDPIDVTNAGATQELLYGKSIAGHLVITSRTGQFVVNGTEALHNGNFRLVQSSSIGCSVQCAPAVSNTGMFFVAPKGTRGYTQVTEYRLDAARATPTTEILTKHIPSYIQGDPVQITCDSTNQIVYILPEDSKKLYVFEYHIADGKIMQQAWHTWLHDKTILSTSVLAGQLYLLTIDEDGLDVHIEMMDMTGSSTDEDFWNTPSLDLQVELTPVLESGEYILNMPYNVAETNMPRSVLTDGFKDDESPVLRKQGVQVTTVWKSATKLIVSGMNPDLISPTEAARVKIITGYTYDTVITPTMPYPRDKQGKSYTGEKLLYTMWTIWYKRSGIMTFQTEHTHLPTVTKEMSNFILGDAGSRLGVPTISDGSHKIKIGNVQDRCQFKIIRSNGHLPFSISHINWGGRLTTKGRRV